MDIGLLWIGLIATICLGFIIRIIYNIKNKTHTITYDIISMISHQSNGSINLSSESIQSASLFLECTHNIHWSDGLSLCMFGVCHGVSDNIIQKHFQHSSDFFIDQSTDSLDSSSTRKTTDRWLSDSLDTVVQDPVMAFGRCRFPSSHSECLCKSESLSLSDSERGLVFVHWRSGIGYDHGVGGVAWDGGCLDDVDVG